MKSVQITYDLFVALVEYHLACDDDYAEEIHQGLEQKLDAMVRHELYAKYKTAPTAEEREQARQPSGNKGGTICSRASERERRFGVPFQSVRRTRSHRMKFCVQKGLGGAALNKQTAGNVSVY